MTQPTIDYRSAAPPPPPARWPTAVAWGIILLVAGFLILGNEYPQLRGRSTQPTPNPVLMNLMGKYAVGASRLAKGSAGDLMRQVDSNAKTIDDQLGGAILAGELIDGMEALRRLPPLFEPIGSPTTLNTPEVTNAAANDGQPRGAPTTLPTFTAAATRVANDFPNTAASQPTDAAGPEPRQPTPDGLRTQIEALQEIYTHGVDRLSAEQRLALFARNDFFGRLALSFGKPDADPQRAAVLHEAAVTAAVLGVFIVGLVSALAIGFVLLVLAVVFYFTGTLRPRFQPRMTTPRVFVEIFAAYLLLFVGGSLLITLLVGGKLGLNATWLLTPIVPAALAWGVVRGLSWRDVLDGLGYFGGSRWYIEAPLGVVGYLAGLPIIAAGVGLSLLLAKFTGATPSHPIQNAFGSASAWQLYGIAAVWAPVVEETFFRGALLNHLRQRFSWLVSAPIVALIFAAIHPQGLTFVPALGSIAIVLAGIREWRGTILSSMVAHGLNNGTVVTLMLLTM